MLEIQEKNLIKTLSDMNDTILLSFLSKNNLEDNTISYDELNELFNLLKLDLSDMKKTADFCEKEVVQLDVDLFTKELLIVGTAGREQRLSLNREQLITAIPVICKLTKTQYLVSYNGLVYCN